MLGDPGRGEADPLGVDELRDRQPVPLVGARLVQQAREEPQASSGTAVPSEGYPGTVIADA